MTLQDLFEEVPEVAVAFSGGTDSAFLLHEAVRLARRAEAFTVSSAFQPRAELDLARDIAGSLGVKLHVLDVDVLADPVVAANPPDRCYYCKKRLFSVIIKEASACGIPAVIDGTNASDDASDRPGMRALAEFGVRSPLRECRLTKDAIRRLSREAGLPTWDRPSYACLATRQPARVKITPEDLRRTERTEEALRALGLRDLRVRSRDGFGLLQISRGDKPAFDAQREKILDIIKKEYGAAAVDPAFRGE